MLRPLADDLNPNTYLVFQQELSLELSDLYSALFELRYEDLNSGAHKMSVKAVAECNTWGLASIKFAQFMAKTIYDTTDHDRY